MNIHHVAKNNAAIKGLVVPQPFKLELKSSQKR